MSTNSASSALPKASVAETVGVVAEVFTPNVAKGVIIRRPRAVAMAERLDLDQRAVRRLQTLRNRYGTGPLMLRLPVRRQAVILDPAHVRRVLDGSPEPFGTATTEKRAALSHFEPKGVLISHGRERRDRRRFNERVLESDNPLHRLTERFTDVAEQETGELLGRVRQRGGELEWEAFIAAWFRIVRRVVFGDGARDDRELRKLINELRYDANWAFLKPRRHQLRRRFLDALNAHLRRAEPGSLASVIAFSPRSRKTAPDHQVPQWLFAFDPAGMATFRALALLATHPQQAATARAAIHARRKTGERRLPYLRACLLEALRLWPTTPMVLRQTTTETIWEGGVMPAGTGILIYAPFFHRDDERLAFAHHFAPELWLEEGVDNQGAPPDQWPLIPFSGGPGICPGRNLVLLLGSTVLAMLLDGRSVRLLDAERLPPGRLPATLDHYSLSFLVAG